MYRPPPPRFPSSSSSRPSPLPPSHPFRSHHTHGPPLSTRPGQAYVCRCCEARGLHFLGHCPRLSEGEKKQRRERLEGGEKRLPDLPHQKPQGGGGPSNGQGQEEGFERNGNGGGFSRGAAGHQNQQRPYETHGGGGGAAGPSHHRNSSNTPNPNLITSSSNPYRTHSRRPSDAVSPPPPPPFHFIPADTWIPSHDENDPELGQARRSRNQRQQEERRFRKDREVERSRHEHDERTRSSPPKRSLQNEKRRERYDEEPQEREKQRGRKRDMRDSGFHEEESPSRRRPRESSAAMEASREQGRRPLDQVSGRRVSNSNGNPDRSPKKNRRPRSPRPSPALLQQQQNQQQQPTPYGPLPPPPRPLLSRIDRAEELIQDESQIQKNTEESSEDVEAYTGPGWNVGFSHYNEKIEVRRRAGSETDGGRMFRVPSDHDRSLPYEMINKVDPMINIHHQRENDVQHFPSWPITPFNETNIPYRPWNLSPPGEGSQPGLYAVSHTSPHKTWRRTTDQGYEVEYPNGKSIRIASASRGPLPPLEQGRLLSRKDSYVPTYDDDEGVEGEDEPEEGEVHSSRAPSEVSSVSRQRRNSGPSEEEEQESRPEEPSGPEDWETLSICQDDPVVEDRSDEPHDDYDDEGGRKRGDSGSDRSMASHSPSPRRDRDRSQSPLGRRSPSNALGITLRPRSTLPSVGRVETPTQLDYDPPTSARHSSRLQEDLSLISPKTLATLLPGLVPVRRLFLEINRPRRLPSSRVLGAFDSSDSLQPGAATPVLSPRIHSCTIADRGFKATLPNEEGKRRLLFVSGTGAGASFWEGGDFGLRAREENENEGGRDR